MPATAAATPTARRQSRPPAPRNTGSRTRRRRRQERRVVELRAADRGAHADRDPQVQAVEPLHAVAVGQQLVDRLHDRDGFVDGVNGGTARIGLRDMWSRRNHSNRGSGIRGPRSAIRNRHNAEVRDSFSRIADPDRRLAIESNAGGPTLSRESRIRTADLPIPRGDGPGPSRRASAAGTSSSSGLPGQLPPTATFRSMKNGWSKTQRSPAAGRRVCGSGTASPSTYQRIALRLPLDGEDVEVVGERAAAGQRVRRADRRRRRSSRDRAAVPCTIVGLRADVLHDVDLAAGGPAGACRCRRRASRTPARCPGRAGS